jgi:hypothetical protein
LFSSLTISLPECISKGVGVGYCACITGDHCMDSD